MRIEWYSWRDCSRRVCLTRMVVRYYMLRSRSFRVQLHISQQQAKGLLELLNSLAILWRVPLRHCSMMVVNGTLRNQLIISPA